MPKAIRWSDDDRYFGPLTFARNGRYRNLSIMLGSGDGDDYPGCRLRISLIAFTIIIALPAILKPWRRWVEIRTEPTRSQMIERGREPGYWDSHEREYGFSAAEGALHVHYGPQTHDSETTKSKCFFYPWREHRMIRHSLYDLEGEHFADLPQSKGWSNNRWNVERAIVDACPVAKFEFKDFDGELITATARMEEREWKRGKGIFRVFYLGRNRVSRSLDLRFSSEVGKRKGSWKGGTVGHSIDMKPRETHEEAFRRYCQQEGLTFVGPLAAVPDADKWEARGQIHLRWIDHGIKDDNISGTMLNLAVGLPADAQIPVERFAI